ncbi:MAG: biotin--[acetyl-CoA-carboxylase] ligase [Chloroflexota bacterium]|nr:biotin--[acetyl-CoA-carboxylase] ligase [Chloroflexota bacterium]
MDLIELKRTFAEIPLSQIHYFDRIGSTNSEAARLAEAGASDLTLVVADGQTAGRGRAGKSWSTLPGTALAFSLVLRVPAEDRAHYSQFATRYTALSALAVCDALDQNYGLDAHIKWPNDVLVGGRKICGVLSEASWLGDRLQAVILGVGVNVLQDGVPHDDEVDYPATSVEQSLIDSRESKITGRNTIDRLVFLKEILSHIIGRRPQLLQPEFIRTWEQRLAYRGGWVEIVTLGQDNVVRGQLVGLDLDGSLQLKDADRKIFKVSSGRVSLREVENQDDSTSVFSSS